MVFGAGVADIFNGFYGHPTVAELVRDALEGDPFGIRISQFGQ